MKMKPKPKPKAKKRNRQDATLINVRAANKKFKGLDKRISDLEWVWNNFMSFGFKDLLERFEKLERKGKR